MPINANGKLRVKGVGQIGPILTEFISVWDTNLGKEPSIELPLVSSGNYNFSVNWGDGNTDTITTYDQSERTHAYATGGIYTITITGTIEGWSFGNLSTSSEQLTSITNVGPLKLGNEGAYFYGCSNLTTIGGIFDLTGTTNFNSMFDSCTSLTSVNGIGSWNTSAVISMSDVFNNAANFNQNIGGWDVSSVTGMNAMFYNATAFNQPLNSWNVSAVTDMAYMFQGATSFNQPLNSWNVSSVTNMFGMFANTTVFDGDISSWDVSAVTDMSSMFTYATAFNQDISGWDVSAVINMTSMFEGTIAFNQDIIGWDVSAVTNMNYMFGDTTAFNQPLNSWDVSSVTDMGAMFNYATSFNQPLNSWNVSSVTNIGSMFNNATSFNQPLNSWNVSAVLYMDGMFGGATAFNQDISLWDVSSVTNMYGMFNGATAFNQDISGWDISNVTYMDVFMAGKTTADYDYYDNLLNSWSLLTLQNGVNWSMGSIEYTSAGATARQDIIDNYSWHIEDGGLYTIPFVSIWDTTLGDGNPSIALPLAASGNYNFIVNWGDGNTDTITAWDQAEKTHTYATGGVYTVTITGTIEGWLFNGVGDCAKLTSITDIGPLKIINASSFKGCSNLTTIGGTFDLIGTTDFNYMFADCTLLTSVNGIGSWNTSAVTQMYGMFYGATAFNQPLNLWDVSSVNNMNNMFTNAAAFNQPLNSWDVSSVVAMLGMFYNATAFNQDISSWDVSGIIGSPGKPEGMADFMGTDGDPLSFSYYDNLLNAWSLLTLQNGVTFGMGTIEYTAAGAAARASIISNYSWTITDGGLAV